MNKSAKLTKDRQKLFFKARKDFQEIQKEIEPFIKHRKFREYSTRGEWRETSSLYL